MSYMTYKNIVSNHKIHKYKVPLIVTKRHTSYNQRDHCSDLTSSHTAKFNYQILILMDDMVEGSLSSRCHE